MVCLLNVNDLSTCLSIVRFGRNPAILIPFYDPDINVVFLTGRVRLTEAIINSLHIIYIPRSSSG